MTISRHAVRRSRAIAISFTAGLAVACGGRHDRSAAPDSVSVAASAPGDTSGHLASGTASTTTKRSTCPPTGLWALCSVQKRLERAGFVLIKLPDTARQPAGFRIRPISYKVGRSTLEVFLYQDEKSLEKDWTQLDSATASPRGAAPAWSAPATLVRSANLAAVFLTESAEEAERLALALTAGAPQPAASNAKQTVLPAIRITPKPARRAP